MNINKLVLASISFLTGMLMFMLPLQAKVEGDKIILGSAISFTGKYSTNGIHASNGYNLAVKAINAAGGVTVGGKSYMLEIVYYDDESTPARTAQLLERLIKQDGIKYMLGPYSSATTKAAAPVTEKYKIPMVEAEGASRSLFTQGYRYLFAVLSTSEQYLASAIALAAELAEKEDIPRVPALTFGPQCKGKLRFFGIPAGYQLSVIVENIKTMSRGVSPLTMATRKALRGINQPVQIQVFVTPTDTECAPVARMAYALAIENENVTADVIEIEEFPALARQYGIRSVPMSIVNEIMQIAGLTSEQEFVDKVLQCGVSKGSESAPIQA